MSSRNARFIVFEGLDGAGTTTQAARLDAYLTRSGVPGFLTHEPSPDPIGAFIRRILTGCEHGSDGSPHRPGERAMGLLFAADRLAHTRAIAARLAEGETVLCDRYVFSSMAYQTLDASIDPQWVVDVNRGCSIPDLTLFLSVPVDVCLARIAARKEATSVYETRTHLETIAANYERLMPLYERHFGNVLRIDGTRSVDEVHEAVVAAVA